MGYSARYHAASLAAVFLALAVGILVGAEFGGEIISDTRKSLERSLVSNLEDARAENDELAAKLDRSNDFAQRVYPALVGNRLFSNQVGIVALGGLQPGLADQIESALEPTGAEIVAIGVVREPPEVENLGRAMGSTRFQRLVSEPDGELLEELGTTFGRQLVDGGNVLKRLRGDVFSRVSGRFGRLDHVIVVRSPSGELEPAEEDAMTAFGDGLISGLATEPAVVVGAENSEADPSAVPFFKHNGIASVDNLDQVSGRLALILALRGAKGNFGDKESADSPLPDLITDNG